jgi:hypothetical protein
MKAADMSEMMPRLLEMLGLGGLRTIEKIKRVAQADLATFANSAQVQSMNRLRQGGEN